ncbi:MAG: recombinase family protein [Clostridia bacterium]|nr:MAG: recombinase family protein [Clostridia bacterium]
MTKSDYANVQKIICYLRRSRQDIERERRTGEDTLSTQKKIMTKVLDDISIPYDMAEEIGSGDKIETRPVFQEVLKWLREGRYNAIAVKEIARLGRGSYSDMGEIFDLIKEKRIYIITPYKLYDIENPSDARQIRFELFFAREEFEMIRERMLSSKLNLAHEGRWVVGATPYGYSLNSKTTRLEIVEEEANIVRMIFDLYVYGMEQADGNVKDVAFRAIAGYLNRLGIPSPRNGKGGWSYLTVQRVIENVAYIGTVKYRTRKRIGNKYYPRPEEDWIVVENAHEPIITREVWNLAQNKLNSRRLPHTKLDFSPCELAGLVICTKCGRRMIRQYSTQHYRKKDGSVSVYKKEFLWCNTDGCTFVKYRDVERDILLALAHLGTLDNGELKAIYEKEYQQTTRKAENPLDVATMVEKKRKDLQRRLDFIFDKYEAGIYSDEDFLRRKKEIEQELASLDKIIPLEKNQESQEVERAIIAFKSDVKSALEVYRKATDKTEKNKILSSIIDRVELTKTGKGRYDLRVVPRFSSLILP